jgi:hypothetical protein
MLKQPVNLQFVHYWDYNTFNTKFGQGDVLGRLCASHRAVHTTACQT